MVPGQKVLWQELPGPEVLRQKLLGQELPG